VFQQLTSTGTLMVGINYGNPNNATRDAAGLLHGVAVDMACVLARRLGVEVQFIGYPGVPPLMQGLANGEFTIGFTQDPRLGPTNIAYANPHIGVENTYLVPAGSSIQTVADADQPGVRISVATGNAPDVYLTTHLQFAQLVRFSTVPQALAALKNGAVDAFSGSRSAEVTFVNTQMPGGRVLTENIFIANLAQVLPLGLPDALRYLNRFVEAGKISFLIQFAVCRAGLIGVSVPPPLTIGKQHDSEEDLSVSARTAKSPDGSEYSDLYMSKRTKVTGPN
jgi:polar amino acid transport system substrate-binding protein